ncbi:MAG: PAS domain S-box protein [Dehalococcoidia bacterium]|nr:PAS domain S-box protein [Dehalococcoidia bacterium]MDD5493964.1 PAS domain S-box protein [Dehalococcoidia bacterium]
MEDEGKTKKQLIKELSELRDKLSQYESLTGGSAGAAYALFKDKEAHSALFDVIQHAICIINADSTISMATPYMAVMLSLRQDELEGQYFPSFMNQQNAKKFLKYTYNISKGSAEFCELELTRRNGTRISVVMHAAPITDSKGSYSGLLVSLTDITDQKRISEELSLSSRLLDAASDSIFLRDLEGNFVYVNEAAYKTRGYTRDELLGASIYQIVAPQYHAIVGHKVKDIFKKGKISFEAAHLRKDGSVFPVDVQMSVVEMNGKTLILSVIHDITQRKKIEEELIRTLKIDSVAQHVGGIARQFNTILSTIIGNTGIAIAESTPQASYYRLLEEIEQAAVRARELSKQIINFTDRGAPVKRTVPIASLLRDTANFVLSGSNVWCNFYIDENLHKVEADEGQLSQALNNIILNASQAMPGGGIIRLSAKNTFLEEDDIPNLKEGDYILITIEDRGPGIPHAELSKIFDPYFTTKKDRLGLGLSIAYSIIKNHGGLITVESVQHKGTTVHIYLPASTAKEEAAESRAGAPASPVRILIVDDEVVVRNEGARMLRRLGYHKVEFAADGTEALQKYNQAIRVGSPFRVVILDLSIPGSMGGKETIKALLKVDPEASIIVSSGYFDEPLISNFRRYGIKGALSKPFKLEELRMILQEILEGKPLYSVL